MFISRCTIINKYIIDYKSDEIINTRINLYIYKYNEHHKETISIRAMTHIIQTAENKEKKNWRLQFHGNKHLTCREHLERTVGYVSRVCTVKVLLHIAEESMYVNRKLFTFAISPLLISRWIYYYHGRKVKVYIYIYR